MDEALETALKDLVREMGAHALRRPQAGWGRKVLASVLSATLLLTGWPIAVPVHAAVPQFLNYQGKLGDAAGNPLTGTYSFRFKFFATETGGSSLFSEDVTATNALSVANGVYSVQIGSVTAGGIPSFVFDSTPVYLEVDVNTGASLAGAETLGPRERIVGSPFSWHSLTTEKLGTGVAIATFTSAGQLAIPGNLTASSGTFTLGGANQFSLNTSSGISVAAGVYANFFVGSGAGLTGVVSTPPAEISVSTINATVTTPWGGVALTSHVFLTAGNLGIGTTAPAAELHVSSANASATATPLLISSGTAAGQQLLAVKGDGRIQFSQSGTAASPALNWALNGSPDGDMGIYRTAADSLGFATAATLRMTVANAGVTLAAGTPLSLSGSLGNILTQSSVTASAFFGDGSQLTGVTATTVGSPLAVDVLSAKPTTTNGGISISSHVFITGASIRLGVGTTNPDNTLDVVGTVDATAGYHTGGLLALSNTGAILQHANSVSLTQQNFYTGGIERMRLDSTGYLGLGTTSPAAELHVSSTNVVSTGTPLLVSSGTAAGQDILAVKGDGRIQFSQSGTAASPALNWALNGSPDGDMGIYRTAADSLGFATAATLRLTIANAGVTLAAGTPLSLTGQLGTIITQSSITTTGAFFGDGSHLSNVSASIIPASGVTPGTFQNGLYTFPNNVEWTGGYGGLPSAASAMRVGAGGTNPNGASLAFGDNTGWRYHIGTNVASVFTPRLTVVDSGNVGIGLSAPAAAGKLQIQTAGTGFPGAWNDNLKLIGQFPTLWLSETDGFGTYIGADGQSLFVGREVAGVHQGYSLFLGGTGRMGVGTTNPQSWIHAVGPAAAQDWALLADNAASTSGSPVFGGVFGNGGAAGYGVFGQGGAGGVYGKGVTGSVGVFGETDGGAGSYFGVLGQTLVGVTGGGGVLGFGYPLGVNGEATGVRGETFRDAGKTGIHVGVRGAAHDGVGVATSEDYDFYAEITNGKSYFAGAVGVGITNPAAKADIKGTGATSATASLKAANSAGTVGLFVRDDNRVGIGTTAPVARLHVSSTSALAADTLLLVSSGTVAGQEVLALKGDGKLGLGTTSPSTNVHVRGGSAVVETIQTDVTSGKAGVALQTTGGTTDVLEVEKQGSTASGTQAGVSLANMSRVIAGASAAHMMLGTVTNNHLHIITGNTERVRVLGTGEVAIGSTSPQGQLHVESVAYTTVTLRAPINQVSTLQLLEAASPDFGAQLRYDGISDRFHILIGAPPSIPFTPRLTILRSNGEVGLGTTNPAGSRLWVQGAATENYHVRVSSQDSTGSLFVVDRQGQVGVGLSNPSHVLELRNPGGVSSSFDGSIQAFTNTGAFNHNVLVANANDTGDSGFATSYAQAYIAGIGNNPAGGNYGVWGHQPNTGSGGVGIVGSFGTNINSPDTWAALGGATWAGFFSGKVEVTGSVQIGSSGATCNSSVDGSTRYEPGAGGLSSRMMVCMKGSDQNFYWKTLNTGGPYQVYSADFVNGATPAEQCGQWNEFTSSLNGLSYVTVMVRGSRNTNPRTCAGANAQTICAALHNGGAVGPIACGGFNWYVGNCGGQEITVDTGAAGICACSATAWTVRPCIRNASWGAVADTTTCGATSQTLEVICNP